MKIWILAIFGSQKWSNCRKWQKIVIFLLLRHKKGSKNYLFKFSYTAFMNSHPKMVSIKNQPIWTKIEDLHTFFVIFFMKNGEIAPRISVFGLKNGQFSKSFKILWNLVRYHGNTVLVRIWGHLGVFWGISGHFSHAF